MISYPRTARQDIRAAMLGVGITISVLGAMCIISFLRFAPKSYRGDVEPLAQSSPSESRDGAQIVFATSEMGEGDIYLRERGVIRPLITSSARESRPLFLPNADILFERESDGARHIWLRSQSSGNETQLTFGDVLDDILSLSPAGDEAIVFRSQIRRKSMGRNGSAHLLNLTGPNKEPVHIGAMAVFARRGTHVVFTPSDDAFSLRIRGLTDESESFLTDGSPIMPSPNGNMILIGKKHESGDGVDTLLTVYDLDNQNESKVGRGHCAAFVSDGEVLSYHGVEGRAILYEITSGKSSYIDAPKGMKYPASRADISGRSLVLVEYNDRFIVYEFIVSERKFFEVFSTSSIK